MPLLPNVQLQPHQQRLTDDAAAASASGEPFKRLAWWTPGSGKSLAAISAAEQLSPGGYTAVVPAALRTNYRKELAQFTDGATPVDLVSYNQLGRGYTPKYPDTVVLDEAHRARSTNSPQAAKARELAAAARHTILLTGTPTINRFGDAAPLVHMLAGKPMTPDEFEDRHQGTRKVGPGLLGWLKGEPTREEPTVLADHELRNLLAGKIDYHETQAKPEGYPDEVVHEDHHVELSPRQAELYSGMMGRLPTILRWKLRFRYPLTDDELARTRSFLVGPRQVGLSDLNYRPDGDPLKAFESSGKLQKAYGLLREQIDSHPQSKALVFSSFPRSGLEPMAAKLRADGIPFGTFDGTLSDQERKGLVERYNNGQLKVALLGPAASEGISLKGAQLFQLLDGHFHNARLTQAMSRGIRFDSHTGLPPELRRMKVQRFYSKVPLGVRDRLLSSLGFDRDHKTETVDHYLNDLAATKDVTTRPLVDLLREVAADRRTAKAAGLGGHTGTTPTFQSVRLLSGIGDVSVGTAPVTQTPGRTHFDLLREVVGHNRLAKTAADRINAGDVLKLVKLAALTQEPKTAAKRFHRPENYDVIRELPDGRRLWAGANDWEAGFTWAWVTGPKSADPAHATPEPEAYTEIDHSACPGCKGTGEDSSAKADSLCVTYGKQQVDEWAAGLVGKKTAALICVTDLPSGPFEMCGGCGSPNYNDGRCDDCGSTEVKLVGGRKAASDLRELPLQDRLRLAKVYSDLGTPEGFATKTELIRGAMKAAPHEWWIDSDVGHTLGVSHVSGWRYHLPTRVVSDIAPYLARKTPTQPQPGLTHA